ncbi:hypothetical protein CQ14_25895 [Bradyrhizobium lablabi]|uniref:Uncharacterized protein n=1 Tax=Bradyrhizobium lablabi TaxID=722472 RepID=A0A0R3MLB8_9BRAD|nr:hypothetical protein CQ14_25895 [Bradyrhizobium lablabi]
MYRERCNGFEWFAICQPFQSKARPLNYSRNATGKQMTTSLIELQTASFRKLGCTLKAPLFHLPNIEVALRSQGPIE